MYDLQETWLPIGSVVLLEGGERLVMVAGHMPIDGSTGHVWDYVGYPYPEGKQDPAPLFFDRTCIEQVYQIGFCDAEGLAYLARLVEIDSLCQAMFADSERGWA